MTFELSFHLMNEQSIAIAINGTLIEGEQLNRLCSKFNEVADIIFPSPIPSTESPSNGQEYTEPSSS